MTGELISFAFTGNNFASELFRFIFVKGFLYEDMSLKKGNRPAMQYRGVYSFAWDRAGLRRKVCISHLLSYYHYLPMLTTAWKRGITQKL